MIRPFRAEDAASIAEIYNYYVLHTTTSFETIAVSAEQMRDRLTAFSREAPVLVAEEDGAIVGYCYAHPWKERAAYSHTYETTVYLTQEVLGKGYGRMLMERLIKGCRRLDIRVLIACITAENTASCKFHEQLGFRKVSEFHQVGRKFDKWLDVVDYELIL